MTYMLIIIVLIIFLMYIFKKNKDILCPHFIYALAMLLCFLCAFFGLLSWNDVKELKIITLLIILFSVFSFVLGCLIANYLFDKKTINIKFNKIKMERYKKYLLIGKKEIYDLNKYIIFAELLFVTITVVLMFIEVRRIAYLAGYDESGFGSMINKFRELSILFTTELVENGKGVNIIVSQMRKVCEVICVFNIFLVVRFFKDKIKLTYKFFLYLVIIFLCFVLSLFTGGRMQLFVYLLAFVFMFAFYKSNDGNLINFFKSNYKKISFICLIVIVGFYILLPLSGRTTKTNIISYMSFYLGASVPSLDKYYNMQRENPKYFGEETLRGFYTVLYKLNITNHITPISKEWVTYQDGEGNSLSSNIFTSAKRYYHDFGLIGVVICQMIFGFVFTCIYRMARSSSFVLVFYSMYVYMCVDQIRDELFFADFVHINVAFKLVILLILFSLLSIVKKGKKRYEK